jgi:predicted nucleic acid-binding protein
MKYVLDASVALKWVLTEADSAKALDFRDQFRKQVHELLAPDIFLSEVAHSLTRAERKSILKQGEAAVLLADVVATPPDLYPVRPLVPRAVDISSQMRMPCTGPSACRTPYSRPYRRACRRLQELVVQRDRDSCSSPARGPVDTYGER